MKYFEKINNPTLNIKWFGFWNWDLFIFWKKKNKNEYDEHFDLFISKEEINNRFHYRPWNNPFRGELTMLIITEDDIQKKLARKKAFGADWNLLILPNKYRLVENQTDDIKKLFELTGWMNFKGMTSKIVFV